MGPRPLTLDGDGAWCYRAIHGVVGASEEVDVDDPVLLQGVPRFLALCERLQARATLFVVGRDLKNPRYRRLIKDAARAGHDVESHSFSHAYDLSRWRKPAIVDDLNASIDAIADVTGRRPQGFRAPGYNLSADLVEACVDVGFVWSSSLLPSPAYFAARAAVIGRTGAQALVRHSAPSASLLGRPWDFLLPRRRHRGGLAEFPMSAPLGVPFTGTTLALLSDRAAAAVTRAACQSDDVSLEVHAADFVRGALLPNGQPDRGVRLTEKLRRIEAAARCVVRVAPARSR